MGEIWDNFKSKWFAWLSAFISFGVALGSYFYVKVVLINENPPPSLLSMSPGRTVLSVNLFAHLVAFLVWDQISTALEALRWSLASRQTATGPPGMPLGSFLALSRATGPMGVASLILLPRSGMHLFYCLKRLSFLGLAWVLGIILTSNIDYKIIYTAISGQAKEVIAGLAPLSLELDLTSLLGSAIPTSITSFYYMCFMYSLLSDNRFSLPIRPNSCSGPSCSSFFLPGGAAIIRDLNDQNMLFSGSGHEWDSKAAVLVDNAPGYHMEFYPPPDGWNFNRAVDCVAYGETEGEGLYICLANHDSNLIAGWSVCPESIWGAKACFNNTSWQDHMDQTTTMTVNKRFATMAYSGTNFSILSMESLSSPELTQVGAKDLQAAVSKILAPISHSINASNPDWINTASTYGIHYGLGWGLRLYKNLYPNDEAPPLEILYNFLSIPFQFSTTAIHYGMGDDHLPADLRTNATVASFDYRAIAEPWVLTTYGAIALFLSLWAMACLFLACLFGGDKPDASKFPEIDLVSRYSAERDHIPQEGTVPEHALGHLAQEKPRKKPQGKDDDVDWKTKVRGWVSGNRGVLELISGRRVRFGLPDPIQSGVDGLGKDTTRVFITKGTRIEESSPLMPPTPKSFEYKSRMGYKASEV